MRTLSSVLSILLVLSSSADAVAQRLGDSFFGISYNISVPASNSKDFTNSTSFRGVSIDSRTLVRENVWAGFTAGWHVFNEKTDEVVSLEDAAIQGTQLRYINSFPLMLSADFRVDTGGRFTPFLGLNAGTYYIKRRVEIGTVAITQNKWHFGLAPEAGFTIPISWHAVGFAAARYNYAFEAGDVPSQSYWSFNFGVAWQ